MVDDNQKDNDDHPEMGKFATLMDEIGFADRYYAYCAAHPKSGPDLPLELQKQALNETGKTFRYDKKEKFFEWRDADAPKGCELGLNLVLRDAMAEWILVLKTPSGHLGGPFSLVAWMAKQVRTPGYRHHPHAAKPDISNARELRAVLAEGFELYELIAKALRSVAWK